MAVDQFEANSNFATYKRNLLVSKITLLSAVFASIHCFIDFYSGDLQSTLFDVCITLVLFLCHIINRLKFHFAAKIIGLLFMNLAFVVFASLVPKELGVFMYYFPLMGISTAVFDAKEKVYRYFFIALPFLLLTLLLATDFKVLGDAAFYTTRPASNFLFVANIISSGIILIVCIDFMRRLNETSENKLQQLAIEIKGKNDDLEKTNKELDRFLYSTSHDLRSPLASIKGLISVARYDTTDKKIHGYFDMVIDRVNRLEHFIKDIIDYSKNSRTELRHEPIDFNALFDEVVESLRYVDNAGSIQFRNDIKIEHTISADKGRLSVVLTNLMANAIKYHDMRKDRPWIHVKVSNSGGTVKLCVSDNGTGISEEHQQKIFDMFYRGTAQSNGSGLGLYIVKQAVEKMQGTITVASAPGQGTEFLIEVPVS
jgi:signal transduction histidine kinase